MFWTAPFALLESSYRLFHGIRRPSTVVSSTEAQRIPAQSSSVISYEDPIPICHLPISNPAPGCSTSLHNLYPILGPLNPVRSSPTRLPAQHNDIITCLAPSSPIPANCTLSHSLLEPNCHPDTSDTLYWRLTTFLAQAAQNRVICDRLQSATDRLESVENHPIHRVGYVPPC